MKSKFSRRSFLASAAASVVPAAIAQASPRVAGAFNLLAADSPTDSSAETWKDAGVIDVSRSPYAKLKTVPVSAVEIQEGFWSKRRVTNLESSIPSMHDELIDHGRMDNFLRLEGKSSAPKSAPFILTPISISGPRLSASLCRPPTTHSSAPRPKK